MPTIVETTKALAAVQAALRSRDKESVLAAESVLSMLVLHLRQRQTVLPDALTTHWKRVQQHGV